MDAMVETEETLSIKGSFKYHVGNFSSYIPAYNQCVNLSTKELLLLLFRLTHPLCIPYLHPDLDTVPFHVFCLLRLSLNFPSTFHELLSISLVMSNSDHGWRRRQSSSVKRARLWNQLRGRTSTRFQRQVPPSLPDRQRWINGMLRGLTLQTGNPESTNARRRCNWSWRS